MTRLTASATAIDRQEYDIRVCEYETTQGKVFSVFSKGQPATPEFAHTERLTCSFQWRIEPDRRFCAVAIRTACGRNFRAEQAT